MRFINYVIAIVFPPLYFLIRNRIGLGLIYGLLFALSIFLLLTVVLAPIAIFFWLVSMIHALWHVRRELVAEQAEVLATKMAEKVRMSSNQDVQR
jgi:hypothetical protein